MASDFRRLPSDVVPNVYNIHLSPDLVNLHFDGVVDVEVTVKGCTKQILLNAAELTVSKASFNTNVSTVDADKIELDEKKDLLTLSFPEELPKGDAVLHIEYRGIHNEKMKGFYHSKYITGDGEVHHLAVTQFEATDARRALPCWDEPSWKAKFKVTLTVDSSLVALSNMPVIESKEDPEKKRKKTLVYDTTPVMSTYLLAFAVGDFEFVEKKTEDGRILARVYTPLGKSQMGHFALDAAVRALPYYEQWFGIEYPLPKADLIAIPDFAAGAMENWGLITYRESTLLIDPAESASDRKEVVALVVAHELAHQWFGNLVTMEWWTHLWLNEGFATWMEYNCVNHCFPDWKIWMRFVCSDMKPALTLDAQRSSHPIEVEVTDPATIDEIFDSISYSKGCTVIRMLASYLGADTFREGLRIYLRRHMYGNAFTEDLWAALSEASGQKVEILMEKWTKQLGYPYLRVEEAEAGKLRLTQSRFLSSGADGGENAEDSIVWRIPLHYITAESKEPSSLLLTEKENTLEVGDSKWVKLNADMMSMVRIHYNEAQKKSLQEALVRGELENPIDRLGIQSDAWELAKAGLIHTSEALDFVKGYRNERDYSVWNDLSGHLSDLMHIISQTDFADKFRSFGRQLFEVVGEYVGWEAAENEEHTMPMLRSFVLAMLGKFKHQPTIDEAKRRLKAYMEDRSSLPANLRQIVYGLAIRGGGEEEYNCVMKILEETDFSEEIIRCQRSLGLTPIKELLQKTLDFAFSDKCRPQDAYAVVIVVARNPQGTELAWKYLQDHWDEINKIYSGNYLQNAMLKYTVENFVSEEKAAEVEAFFAAHPTPGLQRGMQQACETVRRNAAWLKRDEDNIRQWLKVDY